MDNDVSQTELTLEQYQSYVAARQQQEMDYIDDYESWLATHEELANLRVKDSNDRWENSQHNPEKYPDFEQLDTDSQRKMVDEGNEAYWKDSEALENQIRHLESLLLNPADIEKIQP